MPQNQISWTAPEYVNYVKSTKWYIGLTIVAMASLGFAVWNRDIIMFVTLAVIFAVVYGSSLRRPKTVSITLSGNGVTIDDSVYPYTSLKAFWIHYQPPELKTLNMETTNYVNRDITIQLADQDPNALRDFLSDFLPEDLDRQEPHADQFLRRLKF